MAGQSKAWGKRLRVTCYQWPTRQRIREICRRLDGIPLAIGEAKTPVRPAVTWVDGASDIHNGYEQSVPQMFVPNVFSFATARVVRGSSATRYACCNGKPMLHHVAAYRGPCQTAKFRCAAASPREK